MTNAIKKYTILNESIYSIPATWTKLGKTKKQMPAKIRTIRGTKNSEGLISFNKSIGPRGGSDGMITFKEGKRSTKIKLFQDYNEDGIFSKKELIFKGKTSDATYDELTNTSKVKFTRQLHSCTWDLMKKNKPISCTLDYVPTAYELTLRTPAGKIVPEGLGQYEDDRLFIFFGEL